MNSGNGSVAAAYTLNAGDKHGFVPPDEVSRLYDVLEQLSENDCGETYLLAEKSGGRMYVLKCYLKNETGKNVEADILRELNHKGLPCFKAEYENDQTFFVLREYIPGTPLDRHVMEGEPLDEAHTLQAASELCDILTYLHSKTPPIIHRDIKPSNIIIDPISGEVSLIDFGISRRFSENAPNDTVTFGTRTFSPPEQYGFSQTDCRADIYALGTVMRFMLTGKADGKIASRTLEQIARKCTEFAPKDRYKSAALLKKSLNYYEKRNARRVTATVGVLTLCGIFVLLFACKYIRRNHRIESVSVTTNNIIADSVKETLAPIPTVEPSITEDIEVAFAEPLIEKAVCYMLGKDEGQPVMHSELDYITALFIFGEELARSEEEFAAIGGWEGPPKSTGTVNSLSDLCGMKNLRVAFITGQPLSDLSPLTDCKLLESVSFARCNVADISILAELSELKSIDVMDNSVRDFSKLSVLPQLENLNLQSTDISTLENIEKFAALKKLRIAGTQVTDFSLLNELPQLSFLHISPDMTQYLDTLARKDLEMEIAE